MASTPSAPSIDLLLNLVPDSPQAVLVSLSQHPSLASKKDNAGYSLLHAAISYSKLDLARALVHSYNVNADIIDNDEETCLFGAEDVEAAKCAVEELGTSVGWLNYGERKTADEKIEEDGEFPDVAAYLRSVRERSLQEDLPRTGQGGPSDRIATSETVDAASGSEVHPPPPLPEGVKINVGTMEEDTEETKEPDPEFKRRIEELAARNDFQSEEGQRELRTLVTDAVSGLARDSNARNTRPRTE
ncbi:hypothetical protein EV356DRAFT_291083 [Viridothelium virens]|uniref:Ankyrin repeat protein n=1 Tax=Viridothelium virens TaxID=1048519 RepID=A0A6A6H083_VIRVR|nr:hypothetical protein EV356DRAFT_291083 [Viridothelium virens]